MKYEIQIGEVFDLGSREQRPKQTVIIDEAQRQLIEAFAHTRKDYELNTIYKINECEFRIIPHFERT